MTDREPTPGDDDVVTLAARVERERKARRDAEAIAERATRDLYDRQRRLEILEAVAVAANEASEVTAALEVVLEVVCRHMGWEIGHAHLLDADGRLRPSGVWYLGADASFDGFREATESHRFEPGEGLPGRVVAAAEPVWVDDVTVDMKFMRAEAARRCGLRAGVGFPMLSGPRAVGAFEFYSCAPLPPDEALLDLMRQIGTQVGRVVERDQARRRLEQTISELERSNADLEQFAYVASHDLSEPLRMVSGFVQLLERRYKGRLDDDADEFIAYVVDGVGRMQALISDLLDYSRAGRPDRTVIAAVDANETARQVAGTLANRVAEQGGEIVVAELPTVQADAGQLAQVIQNLVANALKFADPQRPPRIEIGAERGEDGWTFSVADNGIGIDAAHRERIFKMFQRLHGRDRYEGTGIGLAICKRIVERRGGKIWADANPAGGSVFRFTIPDEVPTP